MDYEKISLCEDRFRTFLQTIFSVLCSLLWKENGTRKLQTVETQYRKCVNESTRGTKLIRGRVSLGPLPIPVVFNTHRTWLVMFSSMYLPPLRCPVLGPGFCRSITLNLFRGWAYDLGELIRDWGYPTFPSDIWAHSHLHVQRCLHLWNFSLHPVYTLQYCLEFPYTWNSSSEEWSTLSANPQQLTRSQFP